MSKRTLCKFTLSIFDGKVCPKCQKWHSLATDFERSKQNRDGRGSYCRPCRRIYSREKERIQRLDPAFVARKSETKRRLYAENPSHYIEKQKDYAKRHPDRVKSRMGKWRASNKNHTAVYNSEYYASNITSQRERARKYRQKNPEKYLDYCSNRHARLKGAPIVEKINRKDVIARDGLICYLCKSELEVNQVTLDHVVPLSKGGHHTFDNLKVACFDCNVRKKTKTLEQFFAVYPPERLAALRKIVSPHRGM